MKRLLILAALAVVAIAGMATTVQAGAFGLFYDSRYCAGCGVQIRPYNAFTPIACGNMHYCPVPFAVSHGGGGGHGGCNTCGGPGSFGCGGFCGKKGLFGSFRGGCGDNCASSTVVSNAQTAPGKVIAPAVPIGPGKPGAPSPAVPAGNKNIAGIDPNAPAAIDPRLVGYVQPVSYAQAPAYHHPAPQMPVAPVMPHAAAWGYGYPAYPMPVPMYAPAMWMPYGYSYGHPGGHPQGW